jgi:hypothetical protein
MTTELQREREAARAAWEAAGRPAIGGAIGPVPIYGARVRPRRRRTPTAPSPLRPLKKVRRSGYKSADGRWFFCRLLGDPFNEDPCWYAYLGDDELPANDGSGITTLRELVVWAERFDAVRREVERKTKLHGRDS